MCVRLRVCGDPRGKQLQCVSNFLLVRPRSYSSHCGSCDFLAGPGETSATNIFSQDVEGGGVSKRDLDWDSRAALSHLSWTQLSARAGDFSSALVFCENRNSRCLPLTWIKLGCWRAFCGVSKRRSRLVLRTWMCLQCLALLISFGNQGTIRVQSGYNQGTVRVTVRLRKNQHFCIV